MLLKEVRARLGLIECLLLLERRDHLLDLGERGHLLKEAHVRRDAVGKELRVGGKQSGSSGPRLVVDCGQFVSKGFDGTGRPEFNQCLPVLGTHLANGFQVGGSKKVLCEYRKAFGSGLAGRWRANSLLELAKLVR